MLRINTKFCFHSLNALVYIRASKNYSNAKLVTYTTPLVLKAVRCQYRVYWTLYIYRFLCHYCKYKRIYVKTYEYHQNSHFLELDFMHGG